MTNEPTAAREGRKKIAIVGSAPSTRDMAPYGDESWEIWGCSNLYMVIPRWDRWFEIHDWQLRVQEEQYKQGGYEEWLRTDHGKPIYMQDVYGEIPSSVRYPLAEVTREFNRYFTNTISYMVAFALLQEPEAIGIFGVDMAVQDAGGFSEYAHQRPSCEWFLGVAYGRGIELVIPAQSDLLKCGQLYGYETAGALHHLWKKRQKEATAQIEEWERKFEEAKQNLCFAKGRVGELGYWKGMT